jgi:hypothetical protein
MKLIELLQKDYFIEEDVVKIFPGDSKKAEWQRDQFYKKHSRRLCVPVDLFEDSLRIEVNVQPEVFGIECLKSEITNDVIFMYQGRAIYIIRKIEEIIEIANKKDIKIIYKIIGKKEGAIDIVAQFEKHGGAMMWCICQMHERKLFKE